MAKKRRNSTTDPASASGGEIKPISYRPSREVLEALKVFRAKFEYPPDKTAVIEKALRTYLQSQGFSFADQTDE